MCMNSHNNCILSDKDESSGSNAGYIVAGMGGFLILVVIVTVIIVAIVTIKRRSRSRYVSLCVRV